MLYNANRTSSLRTTLVSMSSLRVTQRSEVYREVFDWRTKFVLRFTGSRYIFLRCTTKNTRTDEIQFSFNVCKPSFRVTQRSGEYREVFDWKTKFVLQFTSSRYIFLCCATKNTRTDEATDEYN